MSTQPRIYLRIDNRLLHGQVVQFWLPYLKVDHLVIADDLAASNPAMVSVYRMAVPKSIQLSVLQVTRLRDTLDANPDTSTLVVLSDVFDLARARMSGFDCKVVTLGNIHAAKGRDRITDAVHLTPEEVAALVSLYKEGKRVEIQTFPGNAMHLEWTMEKGARWFKS